MGQVAASVGVAVERLRMEDRSARLRFVRAAERLCQDDLMRGVLADSDEDYLLDPSRNPSLSGLRVQGFVAHRCGRVAGRVLAIGGAGSTAWFARFESVRDDGVAAALLREASRWLSRHGARQLVGPVAIAPAEGPGVRVAGFVSGAGWVGPRNPPHHADQLVAVGLGLSSELRTWRLDLRAVVEGRARHAPQVTVECVSADVGDGDTWARLLSAPCVEHGLPGPASEAEALRHDLLRRAVPSGVWWVRGPGNGIGLGVLRPELQPLPGIGAIGILARLRQLRCRNSARRGSIQLLLSGAVRHDAAVADALLTPLLAQASTLGQEWVDIGPLDVNQGGAITALRSRGARPVATHQVFARPIDPWR